MGERVEVIEKPQCHDCSNPAHGVDGFCRGCRVRRYNRTKYFFTPDLDRRLTKAYREHGKMSGKIKALDDLVRVTGWPRSAFSNRAVKLGLRTREYQHWTEEEIGKLRQMAGEVSVRTMSDRLKRPCSAISHKLNELRLSAAVCSGFTRHQLSHLMGVKQYVINGWIGRGWLEFDELDQRIPHASVEAFVWERMQEYRFASCEEWWLKMMLRPGLGGLDLRDRKGGDLERRAA